jgi:hypothetical protein
MRIYYAYEFSIFGPSTTEEWMRCMSTRSIMVEDRKAHNSLDVTSSTNLWLVIEGNICIIAGCLPTLGGLIRTKIPSIKSTVRSSNYFWSSSSPPSKRNSMRPLENQNAAWVALDNISEKSERPLIQDLEAQAQSNGTIQVSTTISQSHVHY